MDKRNLINGRRPEIGNPEHIMYYKNQIAKMSGKTPVCQIEWEFCLYWGQSSNTGRPIFAWCSKKEADTVVSFIPCPKCGKIHVLLIPFNRSNNWYDEILHIDEQAESFKCWNCHLQFKTDVTGNVYVKQQE